MFILISKYCLKYIGVLHAYASNDFCFIKGPVINSIKKHYLNLFFDVELTLEKCLYAYLLQFTKVCCPHITSKLRSQNQSQLHSTGTASKLDSALCVRIFVGNYV